ncbi:bZIP transcription factor [Teladorsagia circumcincta]|uniref:BZIP transcription factor n=1 Tax=Teladorsagia circumcincta TaxID=45464 RepID=A0A2G9TZE2_TELCI|nr:bZIP transcription factor [Teladorsagia circumcincta]
MKPARLCANLVNLLFPGSLLDYHGSTSGSPSSSLSSPDMKDNLGMINSLSAAQQQLKSRSKMHEMAVRQRLITDQVPTRLPLSKAEEESLKIVRRKIKNKLSAQESRRKRKEYMDTLESRCQAYFNENSQLKSK